ncbi:MAG TPA: MBOAT family O-acyltransferase [Paludibaculum sp.]|jgi:D-alanyl-lipoteichoic acid acyltransferase DltB (MBOAT superfamily)
MPFNTVQFFVFLAVALVLFYVSPQAVRKYVLLAASYFFYAFWNPRFVPLLLTLSAIDYCAALWMERAPAARRKPLLILGLAANLAFLGFFKYFNFLSGNMALLMGRLPESFAFDIVLPLGISFHTLQSISYLVDVYRGEQAAIRNPIDYALFISFFPQLVAGPIVRARVFFRDLEPWRAPDAGQAAEGLFLLVLGLVKKMAFADQFAQVVDSYFKNVSSGGGALTAWSAMIAFSLQIYFDFSGYTDMAIGMAKLFGFHFPVNFRRPYLSSSVTEFWRRWHISLSTWLRDYLYIPMGGNREGRWKTYRNLMATMLLGGLWHGASWNFVMWGGLHGVMLSVERLIRGNRRYEEVRGWRYWPQVALTFALVTMTRVFFRAANFTESVQVLGQMFGGVAGRWLLEPWHLYLAAVSFAVAVVEERYQATDKLMRAPAWAYATALFAMLVCLELFGVVDASIPFVYFQF